MGCGHSGTSYKNGSIRLIATKLTFNKTQLDNLNGYFRKLAAAADSDDDSSKITQTIETIVERLLQGLIAGVSSLDGRFSSMFLVSLNERRRIKVIEKLEITDLDHNSRRYSRAQLLSPQTLMLAIFGITYFRFAHQQLRFDYLLRIDSLSTPIINPETEAVTNVEEDPAMPGFVRLRMRATRADSWAEFLGNGGRLRRDLIKAKIANLLARIIKNQEPAGVDDDKTTLSPGQIVNADVLDKILKQPDHCRVFYGPAYSDGPTPEPKDHRVALVEDSGGILLKIGLDGLKTRDVQVRLLIGVGIDSWSSLADYPRRVPLHHCDALLHYTAAQSGMYAVAVGPYPGARCEDRTTLWRIQAPAAEAIMNEHYGCDSVVSLTDVVLMEILDQLRERRPLDLPMKYKDCLRVVSRHILRTIHRWSLERTGPDPLRSWAPDTLSRHVLLLLDELVTALKCQNLRCYFHPRCNVMLQSAKGGVLHHEDSYVSDSHLVESYLTSLYQHSFTMKPTSSCPLDVVELELISRWQRVMASLPRGTMSGDYGYSQRQLEYLSLVVKEVLLVKNTLLQDHFDNSSYLSLSMTAHTTEPIENLVYLLKLVLKQARDQIYFVTDRRAWKHERRKIMKRRKRCNTSAYFERSVDLLMDVVRRDRKTAYMDLESNSIMAKTLLRWLYFAMDHDRKILEPMLRPYLGNLFNATHENAWHVESWRKRQEVYVSEMRSLAMYCKLVTVQEVSPANGIVESLSKGWHWAESCTRMIERSGNSLRLLFVTPRRVFRYNLTFANNKGLSAFSSWSKARNIGNAVRGRPVSRSPTIVDFLPGLSKRHAEYSDAGVAGHVELRDSSPLTYVVSMSKRRGRQRGPGGLIPALISLNKFRILQEVAALLPQNERIAMLDMVQRVARETSRRLRRASCPDSSTSGSPRQTYTPRSESDLLEPQSTPVDNSPEVLRPDAGVVVQRREQLQREMREIHDTLTRGLRPRQRLPAWDSSSLLSWTSSVGSVGRNRLRRYRVPVWDPVVGSSPMWDSVSADDSFVKSRSEEMISREDSPKWTAPGIRRARDDFCPNDDDRLPSWNVLEATLQRKLSSYDQFQTDSLEINKDVGIDYLLTSNANKVAPK